MYSHDFSYRIRASRLTIKRRFLRALNAVDRAATVVARYFDPSVRHVMSYLGWEQEYFLVDEA